MIPDAAVEAAVRGMCGSHPLSQWEYQPQTARDMLMEKARQAIEAAAPHVHQASWTEGYDAAKRYYLEDEK